ncbi:MAG: Smr protein/MutS2 [Tardiphaga sp.]|nr:Smr protein/MutS2 [Tardiphaga sp.]
MSTKRPPVLDPPQVARRRRALSEDERALWDSIATQTKPLRKRARAVKIVAVVVAPPDPVKPSARKPPAPLKAIKPVLDTPKIAPPLAPIGRREKSSLSRGKKEIDARIDLHGMTQHRAHAALLTFLHRAHRDGLTFVLVITGKGRTVGPESERGILRRQVPLWLSLPEFRMLVVGYEEAGIGHGGEGALYVRVRRAR